MRILIDTNLTPAWVEFFAARGIDVVFTHDLDFGDILAASHARGPSVVQVRIDDPLPGVIGDGVVHAIQAHADHLRRGALVAIDPHRSRIRILPIVPDLAT